MSRKGKIFETHAFCALRIRITLMRIRMRIRILLVTLMRIWILLSRWCGSGSYLHFDAVPDPDKGSKPWKSAQIGSFSIHFGLSAAMLINFMRIRIHSSAYTYSVYGMPYSLPLTCSLFFFLSFSAVKEVVIFQGKFPSFFKDKSKEVTKQYISRFCFIFLLADGRIRTNKLRIRRPKNIWIRIRNTAFLVFARA